MIDEKVRIMFENPIMNDVVVELELPLPNEKVETILQCMGCDTEEMEIKLLKVDTFIPNFDKIVRLENFRNIMQFNELLEAVQYEFDDADELYAMAEAAPETFNLCSLDDILAAKNGSTDYEWLPTVKTYEDFGYQLCDDSIPNELLSYIDFDAYGKDHSDYAHLTDYGTIVCR